MSLRAPRRYGHPPYSVVLVHGGPGAAGSLEPVARELGSTCGALEPWQSVPSVAGQVRELSRQIDRWASPPVVLIGHSWGAWLALLLAGERPELVTRVVLVGSGPLQARYGRAIPRRRRSRLSEGEWAEYVALSRDLSGRGGRGRPAAMRRLGELSERTDAYDPIVHPTVRGRMDPKAFRQIGREAAEMRRTGVLLRAARRVRAPVMVVHGANDPHPIEGVVEPLRRVGLDVRVIRLERCGHEPWWERHARAKFFTVLKRELRATQRRAGSNRTARAVRTNSRADSGPRSRVKSR